MFGSVVLTPTLVAAAATRPLPLCPPAAASATAVAAATHSSSYPASSSSQTFLPLSRSADHVSLLTPLRFSGGRYPGSLFSAKEMRQKCDSHLL